jgi:exodeoxyribonuclease V alpha subunit
MPTHITARIAWHDDGWNGHVCRRPELNTYCIGQKSYPGDVIARERDLSVEMGCAGCGGSDLEGYVPPCCYSYNAFGLEAASARSEPPDFFYGGADAREWELPPGTVCVWPYEAMYSDEVKAEGYLDNDKRRELAQAFFAPVIEDCGENLVFLYANYSNPLSEEEQPRYVLIGAARIRLVGEELKYENVNDRVAERYAGGMVWARNVTSAYPAGEGVRLPYHLYRDDPDRLHALAVFPEDPVQFKYGSKHISDDGAIGLLEQLLARVKLLHEWGDQSEDWAARERWLLQVIAELWSQRGLYPGLLRVLDAIDAHPLIKPTKEVMRTDPQGAHALVFAALDDGATNSLTTALTVPQLKSLSRAWRLKSDDERRVVREVLCRVDLRAEVMEAILSPDRTAHGLPDEISELHDNPYALSELFVGESAGDRIGWSVVDRAVLPLADLGPPLADATLDDERRFRALCVEHLRDEPNHTFRFADPLVAEINARMAHLPETRQTRFTPRYFEVDAEFLSRRLKLSQTKVGLAVYLDSVWEDERLIERVLTDLRGRPDTPLRRPVTDSDWRSWVRKADSPLAMSGGTEYEGAIQEQAEACAHLFRRPLGVVTGPAGTGKTTVITALVRAVRKSDGDGAPLLVLAPTGKAADRAREVFEEANVAGVSVQTAHSLLARGGWLNDNLTLKRAGRKRVTAETIVIDETSMLDLELAAALMRAVDWAGVRRLILVGDPGQLPPIGRGRVFADVIAWLMKAGGEGLACLTTNLRQMLNRVEGKGEAIVALAELFIVDEGDKALGETDRPTRPDQEALIEKLHAGGAVDRDLEVIFYRDPTELADTLIAAVTQRMRAQSGEGAPESDAKLWSDIFKADPIAHQVLTPHRGELHGVEALNNACQKHVNDWLIGRIGAVDGVTVCDKVIQVRNRPRSDMIWAYNWSTRKAEQVEVFNGEIGVVSLHPFDKKVGERWKTGRSGERLKRFNVRFTRKSNLTVAYGRQVPTGGRYPRNEKVEDNLELAYAVSIHKAQGSEFQNTYVLIPKSKRALSAELVYTALTRAKGHCTLLIENDLSSLLDARRRENALTPQIASSLFELHVPPPALLARRGWYESGKIHEALSGDMVRSKSEVIIANLLHQRAVPFLYEQLLTAGDGTVRLPDFTVTWAGETWYWEHLGRLDLETYSAKWAEKQAWYERWFPGRLVTTQEGKTLSPDAEAVLNAIVGQAATD